jgi:hypothetical protein
VLIWLFVIPIPWTTMVRARPELRTATATEQVKMRSKEDVMKIQVSGFRLAAIVPLLILYSPALAKAGATSKCRRPTGADLTIV